MSRFRFDVWTRSYSNAVLSQKRVALRHVRKAIKARQRGGFDGLVGKRQPPLDGGRRPAMPILSLIDTGSFEHVDQPSALYGLGVATRGAVLRRRERRHAAFCLTR